MLLRLRREPADGGFVMIMVIGTMFLLTALVIVAFDFALSNLGPSRRTQDYNAAMAAAQAGQEDFLQHLGSDTTYYTYVNNDQLAAAGLPANPALYDPATNDPGMTLSDYGTLPGATSPAHYRYWVLNCHTAQCTELPAALGAGQAAGLIVEVQGKVNKVMRTIVIRLNKPGILRYAYYTDKETTDPALYPALTGTVPQSVAQQYCSGYYYRAAQDARLSPPASIPGYGNTKCLVTVFSDGDVINGPLHTNDAMTLYGSPTFKAQQTETSWATDAVPVGAPAGAPWVNWPGSVSAPKSCDGCYPPTYAPAVTVDSNQAAADIKAAADGTQGGDGCLYTGPTSIVFLGNGQMTVTSPYTRSTNAGCLNTSLPPGAAQTVSLPNNKAVYVQAVPTDPNDPNYTDPAVVCPQESHGISQNGLGYPQVTTGGLGGWDVSPGGYSCRDGDVFVQGTVRGRTTVAAEHNVTITGNITYANGLTGTDVLGLVADGFVQLYHPIACTDVGPGQSATPRPYDSHCTNMAGSLTGNVTVDAAIFSLQHSFILQNCNQGAPLGTLSVVGAIGQEYRGPVGTSQNRTGYIKNYTYDNRLFLAPPPYYIKPELSQWQVQSFSEQANG